MTVRGINVCAMLICCEREGDEFILFYSRMHVMMVETAHRNGCDTVERLSG